MLIWSDFLFGCIAAIFVGMSLHALYHSRWARRLPSLVAPETKNIRCSIVIAARDEEARIEQTVRQLLAQEAVAVEIHVVDDRSKDRTGEILRRLMKEDSRVKPQRVEILPEGWLGKCHACHVGASSTQGEWILFTDADCWLKPDALARALTVAQSDCVDHVTLTPGVAPETRSAEAWHLAFLISLANWFSGVNRDHPKAYMGMGAFNLVRASAYRACGGYEALRLSVVDDLKLGLLLRRNGKRTRAFIGGDDAECHWGTTALSMIKIMEKNYFAAIDYRGIAVVGLVLFTIVLWPAALIGPFTGSLFGIAAGLGLLTLIVPAFLFARKLGWSLRGALIAPFIYPLLIYAIVNSTVVTLRQRGIRWRDTFYPLDVLRAGTVK
jgi:glycosyltransferase involved in cell wall biosynthesis